MIKGVDHIAILVKNIDDAVHFYSDILGLPVRESRDVPTEGVKVAFLPAGNRDGTQIELVQPTNKETSVAHYLEKHGEGMHHICLEVDNIDIALAEMLLKGATVLDEQPRIAAEGRAIFLHPKGTHGVLLELLEKAEEK